MIRNKIEITDRLEKDVELVKGQLYYHAGDNDLYILAQVAFKRFALICLNDGDYWCSRPGSMSAAFGSSWADFELITSPITLTPGSDE